MNAKTEGHNAITAIADLHERAIERGDLDRTPFPSLHETMGMTSYLLTTTEIDRARWLALLAVDDQATILTMCMLMYRMAYVRCMDDLRNERVVI